MVDPKTKAKTRRLLRNFEIAAINKSFIGACDPAEHEQINEDYKRTRKQLLEHIDGQTR